MAFGAPLNYRDPRFQKALMRGAASQTGNQVGLAKKVTANFAADQTRTALAFDNTFRQKRAFESNLALGEDKLAFQNKVFKQGLKDKKDDLRMTTLLGLGTAGYSIIEGRRRAKIQRESLLAQQRQRALITKLLEKRL